MASTLGVRLGQVQRIEEAQTPIFQPRMMAMRAESDAMGSGSASDYRPGTIRIDAEVNVEWAIRGQDAQGRPGRVAEAQEQ